MPTDNSGIVGPAVLNEQKIVPHVHLGAPAVIVKSDAAKPKVTRAKKRKASRG